MTVVFETEQYGPLVVTNMIDIDNDMTDDIDLAVWVICPLPNGEWLASCASEGTLPETGELN